MLDKLYRIRSGFMSISISLLQDYCSKFVVMSNRHSSSTKRIPLLPLFQDHLPLLSARPFPFPSFSHCTVLPGEGALLSLFSLFIFISQLPIADRRPRSLDQVFIFDVLLVLHLSHGGWPFLFTEERLGTFRQDTSSFGRFVSRKASMGTACWLLCSRERHKLD